MIPKKNPDWEHGIYDCAFSGSISTTNGNVGGAIGWVNNGGAFMVQNTTVYGTLNSTGMISGGLVGSTNWNTAGLQVKNCASFMDITGDMVGGIIGRSFGLVLDNCYATGTIKAITPAAGRVDEVWSAGLVSRSLNTGSISNCYFSGKGTADNGAFFGGVGGQLNGAALSKVYYNIDGSATAFGDGSDETKVDVTSYSTDEMKDFNNYNFSDKSAWATVEGSTPILANQTNAVKISCCNTDEISGTCDSDVTEIYMINESYFVTINVPVEINNGTFKASLPVGTVLEDELITILAKAGDKMWSPIAQAKTDKGSGVEDVVNDAVNEDNKDQTIYNLQGIIVTNPTPGIYIKGGEKLIVK